MEEIKSIEFFDLRPFWFLIKNHGIEIDNEMTLKQALLSLVSDGEGKMKVFSDMRRLIYPDEKTPFQEILEKYKASANAGSGQRMTVRLQKD